MSDDDVEVVDNAEVDDDQDKETESKSKSIHYMPLALSNPTKHTLGIAASHTPQFLRELELLAERYYYLAKQNKDGKVVEDARGDVPYAVQLDDPPEARDHRAVEDDDDDEVDEHPLLTVLANIRDDVLAWCPELETVKKIKDLVKINDDDEEEDDEEDIIMADHSYCVWGKLVKVKKAGTGIAVVKIANDCLEIAEEIDKAGVRFGWFSGLKAVHEFEFKFYHFFALPDGWAEQKKQALASRDTE